VKERVALLRNVAMLSIATYAELAFGLILGVVIARSLGSSEFGHYAFSIWTCGMLVTLSNNALTMSSIKFVAEARGAGQPGTAAALHERIRFWQSISSAIVLALFVVIAFVHPPVEWRNSPVLTVSLLIVGTWSRSGYMMMASIGKGHERFEVESASLVLSAMANVVLVMFVALIGGGLIDFLAVYATCGLVQNLSARIALRRLHIRAQRQPLAPELTARLRRHLLQTGGLVVIGLMGDRTIEVLLLKAFATSDAVGYFAIAGALTKGATYLLAGALSSVLLPSMSRAFGRGGAGSVVRILQESMRFYWFIGVAIAGLGLVFAPGAVRLLYGAQYEAAIAAVTVNLMVSGFVLIAAAFNAFQTSSDHQGDRIRIVVMTLAVNAVVALALVPAFGLGGALGSLAITRAASVCLSWWFARRVERIEMPLSAMTRTLVAAVIAVAFAAGFNLIAPGRFGFLGAGAIFVAVYCASSVVLRAWSHADYDLIAEVFGGMRGPGRLIAASAAMLGKYFSSGPPRTRQRKRAIASDLLADAGLISVLGSARSTVVSDLRVLAYHRILPELDETSFEFDAELVSARQAEFDWQMAYVARRFQPVSCEQVAAAINTGAPLPKRAVMITFDDGFRDNYEVAFPILRRHGLPGLFFLTSGYIGTHEIFWFDWLVHVLLRTSASSIHLDSLNLKIDLGSTAARRRLAAIELLRALKIAPEATRSVALQQLREAAAVDIAPTTREMSSCMTWNQVREMANAGMEFGSHTVSHPILSAINDPQHLRFELDESKLTIEREIGRPVLSLAYPVGGRNAVSEQVVAAVRESGYQFAFTYEPGCNRWPSNERFLLKRLQVERYTTRSMFASSLELPEIFGR
jgi:O-antigen/teichoic acid export membrane protein/peptidoglycan/xylan/chitin deacetylase (PgdA/CDA1 family)